MHRFVLTNETTCNLGPTECPKNDNLNLGLRINDFKDLRRHSSSFDTGMFCGTPCTRSIDTWLFKLKIINVTFILTISIWFNPLDLGEEILEVFYPPFRPQQKPQQIEQNIEDDISAPRSGLSGLYKKFIRKILSYRYARTGFGLPNQKDKTAETTVYLSVSKYSNDKIKPVSRIWSLILWIFLHFSLRVLDLKRPQQRTKTRIESL